MRARSDNTVVSPLYVTGGQYASEAFERQEHRYAPSRPWQRPSWVGRDRSRAAGRRPGRGALWMLMRADGPLPQAGPPVFYVPDRQTIVGLQEPPRGRALAGRAAGDATPGWDGVVGSALETALAEVPSRYTIVLPERGSAPVREKPAAEQDLVRRRPLLVGTAVARSSGQVRFTFNAPLDDHARLDPTAFQLVVGPRERVPHRTSSAWRVTAWWSASSAT
jgi:hypothetical protein